MEGLPPACHTETRVDADVEPGQQSGEKCLNPIDDGLLLQVILGFGAVEAGVHYRGVCGGRGKKNKFVLQARRGVQTGRADPSCFISLQIEKRTIAMSYILHSI